MYSAGNRDRRRRQPRGAQPDPRRPAHGDRLRRQRPRHRVQRDPQRVLRSRTTPGRSTAGRDWTMRGHGDPLQLPAPHQRLRGARLRGRLPGRHVLRDRDLAATSSTRSPRAAFIGGGRDSIVENNIFVDCEPAVHVDARALGWAGVPCRAVDQGRRERDAGGHALPASRPGATAIRSWSASSTTSRRRPRAT